MFLGEISTGASNDLERATDILKAMISYYGMTDENGLMVLEKQRNAFLGGGIGNAREFSEKTAEYVDSFVRRTLDERFKAVKQLLQDYNGAIESMVKELFDKEVIDGEKVREIIEIYEQENNMPSRIIKEQEEDGIDEWYPNHYKRVVFWYCVVCFVDCVLPDCGFFFRDFTWCGATACLVMGI